MFDVILILLGFLCELNCVITCNYSFVTLIMILYTGRNVCSIIWNLVLYYFWFNVKITWLIAPFLIINMFKL